MVHVEPPMAHSAHHGVAGTTAVRVLRGMRCEDQNKSRGITSDGYGSEKQILIFYLYRTVAFRTSY
jgi:hypothetical protein